jgi:hypothetical protein
MDKGYTTMILDFYFMIVENHLFPPSKWPSLVVSTAPSFVSLALL